MTPLEAQLSILLYLIGLCFTWYKMMDESIIASLRKTNTLKRSLALFLMFLFWWIVLGIAILISILRILTDDWDEIMNTED